MIHFERNYQNVPGAAGAAAAASAAASAVCIYLNAPRIPPSLQTTNS